MAGHKTTDSEIVAPIIAEDITTMTGRGQVSEQHGDCGQRLQALHLRTKSSIHQRTYLSHLQASSYSLRARCLGRAFGSRSLGKVISVPLLVTIPKRVLWLLTLLVPPYHLPRSGLFCSYMGGYA
jgi:hypothetical protein